MVFTKKHLNIQSLDGSRYIHAKNWISHLLAGKSGTSKIVLILFGFFQVSRPQSPPST